MIVADTNLVSHLLIEGEHTEGARAVWSADPDWRLPPLWRAEFLNVLATSARAGVLDREQALLLWRRATALLGQGEVDPAGEEVLEVALRSGLSAYDAQFVCLAERLGVPLVTADKAMLRARPDLARSITSVTGDENPPGSGGTRALERLPCCMGTDPVPGYPLFSSSRQEAER